MVWLLRIISVWLPSKVSFVNKIEWYDGNFNRIEIQKVNKSPMHILHTPSEAPALLR